MTPNIHSKSIEHPTPKQVSLKLEYNADNNVYLDAVDEMGRDIATLIVFHETCVSTERSARQMLEAEGYDTTFTQWNEDDSMKLTSFAGGC